MAFRHAIPVAAAAAMMLVLSPPAASAQEGDPAMTVEQAHPASASVHYVVTLAADGGEGDPIDGATVVATPTNPEGAEGQPVTLDAEGDGSYAGSVPLSESGDWTVTFSSTDPEASLTWEQPMPGEVFDAGDGGNDSSPVFPLLFAAAFLLTLAGMGVWALIDRRRNEGIAAEGEPVAADPGIDDAADAHLDDVVGDEGVTTIDAGGTADIADIADATATADDASGTADRA